MHVLNITTAKIEGEVRKNSNIGNASYMSIATGVIISPCLGQLLAQMLSIARNGAIHPDVKMKTPVSIATPTLSSSSIQKFKNLPNAMTCKQIVIALEARGDFVARENGQFQVCLLKLMLI